LDWAIAVNETPRIKARMATENRLIFDPLFGGTPIPAHWDATLSCNGRLGKSKLLMGAIGFDYGRLALGKNWSRQQLGQGLSANG
jgi:hypothetical protein